MKKKFSRHEGESKRRNFADTTVDTAVAAANLVSMIDPDLVGSDEVETLAAATGTEPDFIENLVDLVDQANNSDLEPAIVQENFAVSARKVITEKGKVTKKKNFSSDDPATAVVETTQIVGMLDDEALDLLPTDEIAETISDATGTPVEVTEAIIEVAKNNFHAGRKYEAKKVRNFSRDEFIRMNFDNAVVADPSVPEMVNPDPTSEPEVLDPSTLVPGTMSSDPAEIAQDPAEAKTMEVEEGEVANDPTPVTEAMSVQNELATVEGLEAVPANYSRSPKNDDLTSTLRSLLGDRFIENK